MINRREWTVLENQPVLQMAPYGPCVTLSEGVPLSIETWLWSQLLQLHRTPSCEQSWRSALVVGQLLVEKAISTSCGTAPSRGGSTSEWSKPPEISKTQREDWLWVLVSTLRTNKSHLSVGDCTPHATDIHGSPERHGKRDGNVSHFFIVKTAQSHTMLLIKNVLSLSG